MVFQGKNTIYKQQETGLSQLSVNLCAHFESSDSFFFSAVAVTRLMFTNVTFLILLEQGLHFIFRLIHLDTDVWAVTFWSLFFYHF